MTRGQPSGPRLPETWPIPDEVPALNFWHERYKQQAAWTQPVRARAYAQVNLSQARRVLEVGSGTGVITGDLHQWTGAQVVGLDLSRPSLSSARRHDPETRLVQGDGHSLPFPEGTFDAAIAHYLLLWVRQPEKLLQEMARVLRPGGALLCLAEPDYGGRIDHPHHFASLGHRQSRALRHSGAQPQIGRRLPGLLARAGLVDLHAGILGAEWSPGRPPDDLRTECRVLALDCGLPTDGRSFDALLEKEALAWKSGDRVLYVPTFYAYGRKPVVS